jgi:type VI secretion system protein ImpC
VRRLDVDTLAELLRATSPAARVPVEAVEATLTIDEIEDFHPDSIYQRLPDFQRLAGLRARLADPTGFEAAAAEVRALVQSGLAGPLTVEAAPVETPPRETTPTPASSPTATAESDAGLLERLLGRAAPERPAGRREAGDAVSRLIAGVVTPHVQAARPAHAEVYVGTVDEACGRRMREVLRAPAFRALERTWRSLAWLASSLETGAELELHVLDVAKAELAADLLVGGEDLTASACYRRLVEEGKGTPGGLGWAVIVADLVIEPTTADLRLLAALGTVAAHAGAPLLAGADPSLLGASRIEDLADPGRWNPLPPEVATALGQLRRSPIARWIGLALPGVLLRLPYGTAGEPIESFPFEEVADPADHDSFLWGNPAYACAWLLSAAFEVEGWAMEPGDALDVEDLPAFTYAAEGERRMLPCAGAWLGERTVQAILAAGMMPFMSHRARNAVRLARFQSLADPPAPLAGPWQGSEA